MNKKATKPQSREATKRNWRLKAAMYFVLTAPIVTSIGCASHFVNPWRDELSVQDNPARVSEISTPSVEAARASGHRPTVQQRTFEPDVLAPMDNAVTHGPLYFEDPFESPACDDGRYAWRGQDYLHMAYGPARWMANGLLIPVSVIATPPWVLMASDGVAGQRICCELHDARRADTAPAESAAKE